MSDKSFILAGGVGILGGLILTVYCLQKGAPRLVVYGLYGIAFGAAMYLWK